MTYCPRCGEPMTGGICNNCGFPLTKMVKKSTVDNKNLIRKRKEMHCKNYNTGIKKERRIGSNEK